MRVISSTRITSKQQKEKIRNLLLSVLLITLSCCTISQATLLGYYDRTGMTTMPIEFTTERFFLGHWDGSDTVEDITWDITVSDVGQTLMVTSGSGFNYLASMFTNGTNDTVRRGQHALDSNGDEQAGGEGGFWEGVYADSFTKLVPADIDFYGYTIEGIGLKVNSFVITDHSGEGYWSCDYDVTYGVYGVPEPTTLLILGFGSLFLRRKPLHSS